MQIAKHGRMKNLEENVESKTKNMEKCIPSKNRVCGGHQSLAGGEMTKGQAVAKKQPLRAWQPLVLKVHNKQTTARWWFFPLAQSTPAFIN